MNEELKYAFKKFDDAITKLNEAVSAKSELEKDGAIQRFEFTFELLWKTIKIVLRLKGIDVKTPKDSLKEAFKLGWLSDEKTFLDMLEDRNKTSHIYDKNEAEVIFGRIKSNYASAIVKVSSILKSSVN
jgi:nucleotidyltransferase substrate binding protein (TIGR01987 family)